MVTVHVQQALQSRDTLFSKLLITSPPGTLPASALRHCSPAAVRCWIRAIGGNFPTADYLHRIGRGASRMCSFCSAECKTLTLFACVCPRFKDARTKAHDRVWSKITQCLRTSLSSDWRLLVETPIAKAGLELLPVHPQLTSRPLSLPSIWPVAEGVSGFQTSRSRDPPGNDRGCLLQDLGNWRPDAIAISLVRRKIGILDLSRCSDCSPGALPRAHQEKALKYAPILSALESYTRRGWSVEVLPWIVGIRGFIVLQGIQVAESFLDLPSSARRNIELCAAVESIESLAFMLQVRFVGSHNALTRPTCFPHQIQRKIPPS